jgi:hypothetical protein
MTIPPVLRSLKELLASDDLDAETFDDPKKFLDYARDHVIRLAVLDVWMPIHSGIEVQEPAASFVSGNQSDSYDWPGRAGNLSTGTRRRRFRVSGQAT